MATIANDSSLASRKSDIMIMLLIGQMELNCAGNQETEASTAVEEDVSVLFGNQKVFPRIGNEYQAEIPEWIQPTATITPIESQCDLPITVTPVETEDKPYSSTKEEAGRKDFYLVSESNEDCWSEIEEAGLLLGLYIFGKDFVKLKRFLSCKSMGSMMSFYYGKFYKSDGYQRWSNCRKAKSRKVVLGQKIFSGFRLQELLSRLSFQASTESQNALSKVSDEFQEGTIQLDEFISTVKSVVGMKNLVEAVSIGKGKQDLTGMISGPPKPNHSFGKPCSSLTHSEIIKLITGDIRLSKAKANDLFWEAVWPRLLARGWNSEQPRCYAAVSKLSLVFLTPGLTKFSRRKLIKGDQYFDSIPDVLNKVASDPTLIELHVDESNENEKKSETHHLSDGSYHQPQTSNETNFPIVDTSLTRDGKLFTSRELNMIPDDDPYSSSSDDTIHNNFPKRIRLSQEQSTEGNVLDSGFTINQSEPPRALIDLNYPLLPPGFEPCPMHSMEKETVAHPCPVYSMEKETVARPCPLEEHGNVNGRRQSTRYRPPTARVLEALADGLLASGGIKRDKNRTGRCRQNARSRVRGIGY